MVRIPGLQITNTKNSSSRVCILNKCNSKFIFLLTMFILINTTLIDSNFHVHLIFSIYILA